MPNAQTWPSNQHSSSLTSAQEPCTYSYSKTLQKNFLLKPIRSQANTHNCTIYYLSTFQRTPFMDGSIKCEIYGLQMQD